MLRSGGGGLSVPFYGGHQITDTWSNGANRDNYNPSGLATAQEIVVTITAGGATTVSGIVAQPDGTVLRLTNSGSSTAAILIIDENINSTAANRIVLNNLDIGASSPWNYFIQVGQSVELYYSSVYSRWILFGNTFMSSCWDVDLKSVIPIGGNGSTQPGHGLGFVGGNGKWQCTPFTQQLAVGANINANGFTTVIQPLVSIQKYIYATGGVLRSIVTIMVQNFIGVSNATTFTISGFGASNTPVNGLLPVFLFPGITDNGALVTGTDTFARFDGATLTFFKANNSSGWTNVGNKGLAQDIAFTYTQSA